MRGDRSSVRSMAPGRLPAPRRDERDHQQAETGRGGLVFRLRGPSGEEMGFVEKCFGERVVAAFW